jgi:hypothetical protein
LSFGPLNRRSANFFPDDPQKRVGSTSILLPPNLDDTCGFGERTMFYCVRPEFVHGQADLLGCLRIQLQVGSFNQNGIVTQIMERGELGSDKLSNIRALPIALQVLSLSWLELKVA